MDATLIGPVTITTPLGEALTLYSMEGPEEMSDPFVCDLEIISTQPNIRSSQLLNQGVTVPLELGDGDSPVLHWKGRGSEFQHVDTNDDGLSRYPCESWHFEVHAVERPSGRLVVKFRSCSH